MKYPNYPFIFPDFDMVRISVLYQVGLYTGCKQSTIINFTMRNLANIAGG
jgi:hypothetical protein